MQPLTLPAIVFVWIPGSRNRTCITRDGSVFRRSGEHFIRQFIAVSFERTSAAEFQTNCFRGFTGSIHAAWHVRA